MKKCEMRKEAKRVILSKFKDILGSIKQPYSSTYLDVIWSECRQLEGILWAYRYVGLINDAQFNSLYSIKINLGAYLDIFNPRKKEV